MHPRRRTGKTALASVVAIGSWWADRFGVPVQHGTDKDGRFSWLEGVIWPEIELVFAEVPEPKTAKNRVHIDVNPSGCDQAEELERLLGLGATQVDVGQGDVPWLVLADPEGNEFCLLGRRVDV